MAASYSCRLIRPLLSSSAMRFVNAATLSLPLAGTTSRTFVTASATLEVAAAVEKDGDVMAVNILCDELKVFTYFIAQISIVGVVFNLQP